MERLPHLLLKAIHRTVGPILPPTLLSWPDPRVPGRIHVDDQMLRAPTPDGLDHYVSDARSAIHNVEESLRVAGLRWQSLRSVLDLPSGYGRVTRFLIEHVPPSCVTACDLDPQAVRFCAAEFGVKALHSKRNLGDVQFPEPYDLIFVGSLLTHLPDDACLTALQALAQALCANGLLVFTTQGESCLGHLDWYGARFAAAEHVFRASIPEAGICFVPYRTGGAYGVTLHTRGWVDDAVARMNGARLRLIRFAERGWDRHQDVWSYQRSA
jgi:SAM-dependent methyltransferase